MPPVVTRPVLKSYFPPGGKPTSAQFGSFIDSVFNLAEDVALLGLSNFDSTLIYKTGATVVNNNIIYQANQQNGPGSFNIAHWNYIAGGTTGTLIFQGTWDAENDDPQLASPTPIPPAGHFWVVDTPGDTNLSGITDWEIGDWAISVGTEWQKIDNSDTVTDGKNIGGGTSIFFEKSGTMLLFKTLTCKDGSINIVPGSSTVDLTVNFDDSSTGLTRTWTAFKIFSELGTKEPIITPNGNAGDYWNGLKAFTDFGTSARNTLLSGLSLATNQIISSTDSVIQAFGYLQKQISDAASNFTVNVRNTTLTGLSLTTNQVINASDTIIQAFGYLQKQISDLFAAFTAHIRNTSNPHNVTKAQVGLSEVPNLKENLSATVNPTTSDDSSLGYGIGSTWVNVAASKAFICVNAGIGTAIWIETTYVSVFGKNYQRVTASARTTTPLATFQPKLLITVPALTGNFRLEWHAVVDNAKKGGEFRLRRLTPPAATVGIEQVFESTNSIERTSIGGSAVVNLTGVGVEYQIEYRAISAGDTQGIQDAYIEIYQIS